ncbi:MAG: hypothetical protein Q7S76_04565 [bacterium]|nr:hypothetical protein [bacterium]
MPVPSQSTEKTPEPEAGRARKIWEMTIPVLVIFLIFLGIGTLAMVRRQDNQPALTNTPTPTDSNRAPSVTSAPTPTALAPNPIPQTVLDKYAEVSAKFRDTIGASLSICTRGNTYLYVIGVAGGYVSHSYYYDETGVYLGGKTTSDAIGGDENRNDVHIDLMTYACTTLK